MTEEQLKRAQELQLAAKAALDEALPSIAAIVYVAVARKLYESEGIPTADLDMLVPRKGQ